MLTKGVFLYCNPPGEGSVRSYHSLSAIIHQKRPYSASKQRFLTVVSESGSLLDSKYGRLCTIRNEIYKTFREF